jgi:hypothetical protein
MVTLAQPPFKGSPGNPNTFHLRFAAPIARFSGLFTFAPGFSRGVEAWPFQQEPALAGLFDPALAAKAEAKAEKSG